MRMEENEQRLLSDSDPCDDSKNSAEQSGNSAVIAIYGDEDDILPINMSMQRFLQELSREWRKIWYLAGPAIFTSICQYTIGATTEIFTGQLGTIQLAALSVENSVIAAFSYGILMGMGSALETLCGQAYGAHQLHMIGIYLQRSWVILHAAALATMSVFIFCSSILKFLGQTTSISEEAGKFALWMIPQQFAYALLIPLTKFLQAQSMVIEMAVIAAATICLHVFLSWLVMMKLEWGLPGAAVLLNSSWWFMAVAQFLFVIAGFAGRGWSGFSWKAFTNLSDFVKLSISSAIMFCLEIWYVMALTLVAGRLENAEVSVDALSICMNVMGWSTMVGLGLNVAVSVRVSNELGSGNPKAAKFSSMVVGATSLMLGLLFALILIIFRKQYPALFSISEEVKQLVQDLTPLLALSIIFSCVQYALSGVAIGAGWQKFVAFLSSGCYFILGVPFGVLLCYKFDMGVKGLWCGMVVGVALQSCLLFWVICVTNWNKEASAAQERIEQWEGAREDKERVNY